MHPRRRRRPAKSKEDPAARAAWQDRQRSGCAPSGLDSPSRRNGAVLAMRKMGGDPNAQQESEYGWSNQSVCEASGGIGTTASRSSSFAQHVCCLLHLSFAKGKKHMCKLCDILIFSKSMAVKSFCLASCSPVGASLPLSLVPERTPDLVHHLQSTFPDLFCAALIIAQTEHSL